MRVFLRSVSGKNSGTRIQVPGHRFLIGRAADCHLRAHSDQVSTHHCEILLQPGGPMLFDLGSRNGTFVDGQRLDAPRLLRDGALIQVGPLQLMVEVLQGERRTAPDTERGPGSQAGSPNLSSSETSLPAGTLPAANLPSDTLATPVTSLAAVDGRRPLAKFRGQSPVQITLHVASGRNTGVTVPVQRHRFVIGRAKDCHLCAHSDEVSGHHCEILVQPNGVLVLDLGSRNGTFVNGKPIDGPCALYDGTRLRVGPLELLVEISEPKWRRASEAARDFSSQAASSETSLEIASSTAMSVPPSEPVAPEGFDIIEFLSEPTPGPPSKSLPVDIMAEIRQSVAEQAEADPPDKARNTKESKESKEAAADGLKRLFTPRPPNK